MLDDALAERAFNKFQIVWGEVSRIMCGIQLLALCCCVACSDIAHKEGRKSANPMIGSMGKDTRTSSESLNAWIRFLLLRAGGVTKCVAHPINYTE